MRREAVQDERNRGSGGGAGGGANNSGGGGGQVSQSLDIKLLMVQFFFIFKLFSLKLSYIYFLVRIQLMLQK